ncbi:hypothetical protein AB0903_19815 [Streptomyces sp. NPDC048389]|uniref:hypothetical protein n=1 Tax=Streptomyces sp. NPDC048389 TaxID=3154622 RepID=UPI003456C755
MAPSSTTTVQEDHVALAEIELCGELMIAASAAVGERLSPDRIDEVLMVAADRVDRSARADRHELPSPGPPLPRASAARSPGPGVGQPAGRRRA